MAEYTTHYNLKKPAKNENYNIDVANQNNDIIDEKLYGKVDKKAGKDLSTNDFTNEYKKKLDTLKNYDDAEVIKQITSFNERAGKVEEANTEISKNVEALKTDNETNKTAISELKETTAQNSETITAIQEEQTTQNENIEKNAEGIAQNKKDVDEELTKIKKENSLLKSQIPEGHASGNNIHLGDSSNMDFEWKLRCESRQETRELSQKQASGEQVKLVDVDPNKFIDIFANGNNEQKTTKGKQLFNKDNPDFSATGSNAKYVSIKNGFKIVCNKDETTYSGSTFKIRLGSINDFIGTLRIKTTAIVSGNGTFRPGLKLFYGNANNFSDSGKVAERDGNYGGTTNFDIKTNITEQSDFTHLYLVVYGNSSGNAEHYMNDGDYTIYDNFIITLNNDDMTYEPYTGGISSPNPEYRQDIEVIDGYNKLDFKTMLKNAGAEFTESKGVFTISSRRELYSKPFKLNLKPNCTYTMYQECQMQETPNLRLEILKGETYDVVATSWTPKEDLQDRKITFTTDENSNYYIRGNWGAAVEPLIYNQPILVEGTELKPYLPYGYIGLEQSGKNKVDFINYVEKVFDSSKVEKLDDGSYKFKHSDGSYPLYEGLLKSPCTLSFWAKNETGEAVSSYTFSFKIFYEDGTYDRVPMITNEDFARKEFKINKNVIKIANTYTSTKPFTIIKDVQLEEGSTATSYEPYHKTKVIPINLQENTLAKVGSIKDKLIIHRNGKVEIEKNTWKDTINTSSLITLNNGNKGLVFVTSKNKPQSLSDSDYLITNAQRNKTFNDGTVYQNPANFVFVGNSSDTLESIQAKFNGGEILYQLETPQTIKLPSIEPIELWQGTVNIEIIGNLPTDMNINYNILPAMPSLDYPSQIKNVGDDVNLAYISSKTDYNYSSTLEKDAVLINGTSTNAGNIVLYLNGDDGITLKANKKYIVRLFFDGDVTGNGYKTIYLQGMTIGDIASNKMVTKEIILSEDKVCKTINLDLSANCIFDNMKVKVMITENGKLKEYIPYNCIKVTICNKNLYKVEKVINDSNIPRFIFLKEGNVEFTTGTIPLIIAPTTIKEKTEYTYILKCKSNVTTENNINFTGIYEDGTRELLSANKKKDTNEFIVKFKTDKEKTLAYVTQQYTNSSRTTIITKGTMILEGDYLNLEETYEIHQEQEILFPLVEGQKLYEGSYLAKEIHNKRAQDILTGEESLKNYHSDTSNGFVGFSFIISNKHKKNADFLCTHLTKNSDNVYHNRGLGGWLPDEDRWCYICVPISILKDVSTPEKQIESMQEYLKEQYNAGTPMIFEYELATEEIIPYTPEQQAVIDKILYTYKNVTNISVDNELAMLDITYKKDIETMFNNQAKEYNERLSNIESLLNTTSTSALLLDNLENDLEKEV